MFKILIPEDVAESGKEYLKERGYELKVGVPTDVENLKKEIRDADGILVRNALYSEEVLAAGEKLKVIGRHGTGVDNIDVAAATRMGIQVTNAPVSNINAVAEYTAAMIIALGCRLRTVDQKTRAGDWSYRKEMPKHRKELKNCTLGVIGYGRVGKAVAEKMINGFGMKVVAYNLVPVEDQNELLTVVDGIEKVLREADFVTVHVPATPQTKGMFHYDTFKQMKPGAFFINCARGDVVVEEDLARALKEGILAGAALDVYAEEPLPSGSPILECENVIFSQHNASLSQESADNMSLHAAIGIDEVLTGKAVTWPVNHID
ncbi:MAG: hydroxyacid dehydrogenase [Clostridium sp.]